MSVLSTSHQDNRLFSAEIASRLGDINAAVIIQQIHYWMGKDGVGTIIDGVKYIYNSFNDWVKQFPWLSVWQFRKAMKLLRDLEIVKVIRHKSRQWNQTNYYTLSSDRLIEFLNPRSARSTETVELCVTTDRDVSSQQIDVCDSKLSLLEQRKTDQRETAESKKTDTERSLDRSSNSIAAAFSSLFSALEEEIKPKEVKTSQAELNGLAVENKAELDDSQDVVRKESKRGERSINVTELARSFAEETSAGSLVNSQWKSLVEELDSLGVPINKTLVSLVKMYSEEVKKAIALSTNCQKRSRL